MVRKVLPKVKELEEMYERHKELVKDYHKVVKENRKLEAALTEATDCINDITSTSKKEFDDAPAYWGNMAILRALETKKKIEEILG